eukprot:8513427-Pyramimonas_sp.AAC.1
MNLTLLRDSVNEYSNGLAEIEFVRYAKYLGIYIGPEAGDLGWQEPLRKFCSRTRSLRQMGLGLAVTLSTFQVMCLSVLQFVLQLYPVPQHVLKIYQETLQLLMAAPRHSFSYNMITRLKSLGFDCEAKEIVSLSAASRVRFAASC